MRDPCRQPVGFGARRSAPGNSRLEAARTRSHAVPRDLISFDDGAMTVPAEDVPAVATAAHQVVDAAKDAGVWVIGGGLLRQRARIVTPDGTVTVGPDPEPTAVLGGFAILTCPPARRRWRG